MIQKLEQRLWGFLKSFSPRLYELFYTHRQPVKYIIAGGTAVCVDVGVLFIAKSLIGLTLIPAVATGFLAGFCASFVFQKFWAFEDISTDRVHTQASLYFIVAVINFFLNLGFMYVLVEILNVWYILAKILVAGSIACGSFFLYKHFIFSKKSL